jgi:hypothetical protein
MKKQNKNSRKNVKIHTKYIKKNEKNKQNAWVIEGRKNSSSYSSPNAG